MPKKTITNIQAIEDLQELVRQSDTHDWKQFGHVTTRHKDDMILFTYTIQAIGARRWNPFERMSRGLILQQGTGEIVARPFDKFFDYGQYGNFPDFKNAHLLMVQEKLDGSFGFFFWHDQRWQCASHKGFEAPMLPYVREHMGDYDLDALPRDGTSMVEVIQPDYKITIDYGQRSELVLLAVRNNQSGAYMKPWEVDVLAEEVVINRPRYFALSTMGILETLAKLGPDMEGYVAEYSDGSRFKFKGELYLEMFRAYNRLSRKRVAFQLSQGAYETWFDSLPGDVRDDAEAIRAEVYRMAYQILAHAQTIYDTQPRGLNRKAYARWVSSLPKAQQPWLLELRAREEDGFEILPAVYKQISQMRNKEELEL